MEYEFWYKYSLSQLETKLGTDLSAGLRWAEVKKRVRKYPKNEIFPRPEASLHKDGRNTVIGSLSVLLIIISIIYFFTSRDVSVLFASGLVILNYTAVIIACKKAYRMITRTEKYSDPEIRVVREGRVFRINQKNIVPGDIILLAEGDIVPCDARITEQSNLRVLEKNISGGDGEKDAGFICYEPDLNPSEQKSMLFAASVVSRGEARVLACDTGPYTLAVRRGLTKRHATGDLSLMKRCKRLSNIMSIIMIFTAFALTAAYMTGGGGYDGLISAFVLSLSYSCAAMCEFYGVFAYITIARGIFITAKKDSEYNTHAIIKNVSSIEKMKNMTCIAVPKISGFCEDNLSVERCYTQNTHYSATEREDRLIRLYHIAYATIETDKRVHTAEEEALIRAASAAGITEAASKEKLIRLDYRGMDRESMFFTCVTLASDRLLVCTRGAVKQTLYRCTHYHRNSNAMALDDDMRRHLLSVADEYEKAGLRVVAIASGESVYNNLQKIDYAQSGLCFEGFFGMSEPVASGCGETVKRLGAAGIKVLLFCDDISEQNKSLAKALGVISSENEVLTSYEFGHSNLNLINIKMKNYRLFEGFGEAEKKYVISYLSKHGERVGIVGKGLSDISLMTNRSTVSFAANRTLAPHMQKAGAEEKSRSRTAAESEALKFASDAVILNATRAGEGGINSAAEAIASARSIYNRAGKTVRYFTFSLVLRMVLVILAMFGGFITLTPTQILFCGLIIDLCVVFIISEGSDTDTISKKTVWDEVWENPHVLLRTVYDAFSTAAVLALFSLGVNRAGLPDAGALPFFSTVLCSLAYVYVCERANGRLYVKSKFNLFFAITVLCTVELFILSTLFSSAFVRSGFGTCSLLYLALALIPALLTLLLGRVMIKSKKNKKTKRGNIHGHK